jgi:hypothetical protein
MPYLHTFLVVWFFLASAAGAARQEAPPVVEVNELDNATHYRTSRGDCAITWIAYHAELNKGVVKHRSQCPEPLSSQLPMLTAICEAFLNRDRNAPAFRTLFWGGLVPESSPASLEMPLRLALAAYKSPGWDAKNGRPKNGDINGYVKDLANRELIYPELKELFRGFHRAITLSAVEKVRVLEARKLPFYDQLRKQGIKAADKLPFDCMAWFSVSVAEGEKIK